MSVSPACKEADTKCKYAHAGPDTWEVVPDSCIRCQAAILAWSLLLPNVGFSICDQKSFTYCFCFLSIIISAASFIEWSFILLYKRSYFDSSPYHNVEISFLFLLDFSKHATRFLSLRSSGNICHSNKLLRDSVTYMSRVELPLIVVSICCWVTLVIRCKRWGSWIVASHSVSASISLCLYLSFFMRSPMSNSIHHCETVGDEIIASYDMLLEAFLLIYFSVR